MVMREAPSTWPSLTSGVRDYTKTFRRRQPTNLGVALSTTSSPRTSSLDGGLREQDEIFVPSSDSREPIDDLLAAKMGRGVYHQKVIVTDDLTTDAVYMPRKSRVGGFHGGLNAPGQHQR